VTARRERRLYRRGVVVVVVVVIVELLWSSLPSECRWPVLTGHAASVPTRDHDRALRLKNWSFDGGSHLSIVRDNQQLLVGSPTIPARTPALCIFAQVQSSVVKIKTIKIV
jgi:hypothetical protein